MTETEYLSTAAKEDKPFTFTRTRAGADPVEFLPGEGTRIRFANRAADTLEVVGVPAGFLLAGDTVTVAYLGTTVFRGDVEQRVEDLSRGDNATQRVTVRGPWAKMARLVCRQNWRTGNGLKLSSRLILNQAEDGTNQTLNVALRQIAWGSDNGVPAACGFQIDAASVNVSTQKLPFDETRDITVADAITRELRFFPAAVARFDYSVAGLPALRITLPDLSGSDAAYVASIPKTVRQYVYNAHPVRAVALEIETVGDVDGVEYRDITHQVAPANYTPATNDPDCLYATLQLAGFSSSSVQQSFTAQVENVDASYWNGILDPQFWKDKHPRLKNVPVNAIQIITADRSGAADAARYPNICANTVGEITAAGLRARVESWTCRCKIQTAADVEEDLYLQMQFVTTNAQNRTYTWTASSSATAGETVPGGLAAALLAARSQALKEESFTLRLGTALEWPTLGDICDGLVLQEFEVDCGALTAELHFGTPDYLSPEDMAALMTSFRNKRRATFSSSRVTGKPADDAPATVEMGGVMPLSSTEFAPGTKAKTTIKSSDSNAGGTVVTDATGQSPRHLLTSTTSKAIDLNTADLTFEGCSGVIKVHTFTVKKSETETDVFHALMCRDVDIDLTAISGGGESGGGSDGESGGGGGGGMFAWKEESGTMGPGGVMVGRTWVQATGVGAKSDGTYFVKVTFTSSGGATAEVVSSGGATTDTVCYIPIYTISDGKVTLDLRGAFVVPAWE